MVTARISLFMEIERRNEYDITTNLKSETDEHLQKLTQTKRNKWVSCEYMGEK